MRNGIPGVCGYLDDILIPGRIHHEHGTSPVSTVLKCLSDSGLKLNGTKGVYYANSVQYLGFRSVKQGLHSLRERIQSILGPPISGNINEMQSFFYDGTIQSFPNKLNHHPHTHIHFTSKKPNGSGGLKTSGFDSVKREINKVKLLVTFYPRRPTTVQCDVYLLGDRNG